MIDLRSTKNRCGLSLLEVVLAIVILAMSLVAIGQLMSIGAQQSLTVIEQSRGQQHAQSLLDSVAVGIVPMQSVGLSPIEFDDEWEYSLEVEDSSTEGLKSVTAIVQLAGRPAGPVPASSNQSAGGNLPGVQPSTVMLSRLILDPTFVQDRVLNRSLIDEAIVEEMIAAEELAAGDSGDATGGGR